MVAAAGALIVLGVAVVAVRAVVDDGSGGPTVTSVPAPAARLRREIDKRLAVTGTTVAAPTAVQALKAGVDRLLQAPAVDLNYTTEGTEAGHVTATGVVVPSTRALDLRRTTDLDSGRVVVDERRVVNGTVYLRVIDRAGPGAPGPWDSSPVAAEPQADFDRVLTAGGDADGSTRELIDLVQTPPFTASRLPGEAARFRFLRRDPVSAVEFTVGPDGALTDLSAYGTVFEDGEPIGPAVIDIHYRPTPPQSIVAPPPAELRR